MSEIPGAKGVIPWGTTMVRVFEEVVWYDRQGSACVRNSEKSTTPLNAQVARFRQEQQVQFVAASPANAAVLSSSEQHREVFKSISVVYLPATEAVHDPAKPANQPAAKSVAGGTQAAAT